MPKETTRCRACRGRACKGGGNKECLRRNTEPSRIAAVLDRYGGVRVIVTHEANIAHHLRCDELAVVANLIVHEPIAWDDIPMVIARAEWELDEWIARSRPNQDWAIEACAMRKLRKLENRHHAHRALNLEHIAET